MSKSRFNGIDPKEIEKDMVDAISAAMSLNYSLERAGLEEEVKLLHEQVRGCYHALAQVQNAIELEKYDSGDVHPCVFSATAVMEQIVTAVVNSYARGNYDCFKWDIDKGIECFADPKRFKFCIMNLIVNSFQHAMNVSSEIKVEVSLKQRGNFAVVRVRDNCWVHGHKDIENIIANARYGGFAVMKRFCQSVGTRHVLIKNETTDAGGLAISIEVPLKPNDPNGTLSLKSSETPAYMEAFASADLLIYKLPQALIKL